MKLKWTNAVLLAVMLCATACLTSSCAWSIGEGKEGTTIHQNTRGQELIDLKRARDADALSEGEYQAQRKKILDR